MSALAGGSAGTAGFSASTFVGSGSGGGAELQPDIASKRTTAVQRVMIFVMVEPSGSKNRRLA
jgi:hypothetical protein